MALAVLSCLLAGCNEREPAVRPSPPEPAPIAVDWSDPQLSVEAGDGWTIRRCTTAVPALCVDLNGAPAGHVLMEDVPSLGQEGSQSADLKQATLAVRTQTVYGLLQRHRTERCGPTYTVETVSPRPMELREGPGLKYGAAGSHGGRVVERTIGYRLLRGEIETLIEATAIEPGTCLTPEDPTFTVEQLAAFEPVLDRVAAGSHLPAPTDYPDDLPAHITGSRDPRADRVPTNGIAISYGLRSGS